METKSGAYMKIFCLYCALVVTLWRAGSGWQSICLNLSFAFFYASVSFQCSDVRFCNTSKIRQTKMPESKPDLIQPVFANVSMNDIDEISGQMGGWENDWRQLDAGRPQNRIKTIVGQHTVIQQVHLSHSVHQQGKTPSHMKTFGFPDFPSQMIWDGREFPCPAMFDFNGTNGYNAVSGRDFCGVTVSFPTVISSRIADLLQLPEKLLNGSNLPRLMSGENYALCEFRQYLHRLCEGLPNAKTKKDRYLANVELDEELPVRLLTALMGSRSVLCDRPLKVRQKGLHLAVEFLEANCRNNPTIPNICAATDLSWRSLDRVFRECFGIGPKRYLLNLRLTQVRRKLKGESPRVKIVDIANDWGFWHMGQFAKDYHRMFAELPSETLRDA
jgi:AraC-like DNA-binding protein